MTEEQKALLGDAIRAVRVSGGLTKTALADIMGCHNTTIGRYESGEIAPTLDMLQRILEHAGEAEAMEIQVALGLAKSDSTPFGDLASDELEFVVLMLRFFRTAEDASVSLVRKHATAEVKYSDARKKERST